MKKKVVNYQCPSCGGTLYFDGTSSQLKCNYCQSLFPLTQIREKNIDSKVEEFKAGAEKSEWDISTISSEWGDDLEKIKLYQCPSCGAEMFCEETTGATQCPYCDNPGIMPEQFAGNLKPDYIIPFSIEKQEAIQKLKEFYKWKLFLPINFKKKNRIEEIKGVYVPFWLYDAETYADATFTGINIKVYTSGDYKITEKDYYEVKRSGNAAFEKIPADGSKKMPDDYMDSIEPFDYSGLKSFSTLYLPGYVADRYDVSAEENAERADDRCRKSAVELLKKDVTGYDKVITEDSDVSIKRGKVHYALMPVWMLKTKAKNKEYMFMINGQTGKTVGDLPVSKVKYCGCFVILVAVLTSLFWWICAQSVWVEELLIMASMILGGFAVLMAIALGGVYLITKIGGT